MKCFDTVNLSTFLEQPSYCVFVRLQRRFKFSAYLTFVQFRFERKYVRVKTILNFLQVSNVSLERLFICHILKFVVAGVIKSGRHPRAR